MSCRVASRRVVSCHIISCHIMSRVMLRYVTSRQLRGVQREARGKGQGEREKRGGRAVPTSPGRRTWGREAHHPAGRENMYAAYMYVRCI